MTKAEERLLERRLRVQVQGMAVNVGSISAQVMQFAHEAVGLPLYGVQLGRLEEAVSRLEEGWRLLTAFSVSSEMLDPAKMKEYLKDERSEDPQRQRDEGEVLPLPGGEEAA